MRIALAFLFVLHGIAHLPSFLVPWRPAAPSGMQYKTTVLGGMANLGAVGIRVVGLLWLAAGLGFMAAGITVFRSSPVWETLTVVVAVASLALGVLGWPDSRIGVAVNLLILGYVLGGGRAGWLPGGARPVR